MALFFFCLVAHGFAYFNFAPSHDVLNYLSHLGGSWEIGLGRFFQPLYDMLRGGYVMPWLTGILTMLFGGIACFLISDLMNIKNRWLVFFSAGAVVANASMTEVNYSFVYLTDVFTLALLFACAGAFALVRVRGAAGIALGCVFFTLAMGIYQSYIMAGVILLVFDAMKHALHDRSLWKSQWKQWGRYVLCVVCTAVVYFGVFRLLLLCTGIPTANTYNSPDNLTNMTAATLLQYVKHAYSSFLSFFFGYRQTPFSLFYLANMLLFGLAGVLLMGHLIREKLPVFNWFILLIGAAAVPAFGQFMSILTLSSQTYFLASHPLFLLYPGLIALIGSLNGGMKKASLPSFERRFSIRVLALFTCGMLIYNCVRFSNEMYMFRQIQYDKTVSHVTRIMDDLHEVPGYQHGETEVVFFGSLAHTLNNIEQPEGYRWLTGMGGAATTYSMIMQNFIYMMGERPNIQIDSSATYKAYSLRDDIDLMPCYPTSGYCAMVDGVVVVRLSKW